jgi:hypothetical protein
MAVARSPAGGADALAAGMKGSSPREYSGLCEVTHVAFTVEISDKVHETGKLLLKVELI